MNKAIIAVLSAVVLFAGCAQNKPVTRQDSIPSIDRHMKNVTRLTFDGDNGEAYFSPDGKRLIFQSNRGGYACDKIWIMNTDGSDMHMVSPDHGAHTCSYFFPDNSKIIFASTSHLTGNCPPKPDIPKGFGHVWPLYPYDIFIAGMDGTKPFRITDHPEYDAEPIISPDGKQIVFGSKRFGDFDVYLMESDGSNVRRLTDRIGYDGGPWISPDGKRIVWRAWYPETAKEKALWQKCMDNNYIVPVPLDLWIMDSDGGNKKMILRNGATNFAPSWHPDGNRIIFSSNMDDWQEDRKMFGHNFELYIVNADGTGLERITYNRTFDGFPMFSPDGKKLAFASNRNPLKPRATDIFIADWVE
jgi:Tol biopolymer transport system component